MADFRTERVKTLIATARCNPEFAARMLQTLPADLRALVLAELNQPAPRPERTTASDGPSLRKCRPEPNNGLSAQLNSFARSVGRVR